VIACSYFYLSAFYLPASAVRCWNTLSHTPTLAQRLKRADACFSNRRNARADRAMLCPMPPRNNGRALPRRTAGCLQPYPHIPFERYADHAICHCKSAEDARALWSALQDRFAACKLVLHPEKTKIVYCKDANRRGNFPNQSLDFLGFTFRARKALGRGRRAFACFLPAASPKALTSISRTVRR
jgi:hypothetical protein